MKRVYLYILLFLVIIPFQGFCLDVTVQVDKNHISENDSILLQVIIKGGRGSVDTSVITDFKVIPRGTSTSVNIINGNYSKTLTHRYVLQPLRQGKLRIPALKVTDNGELFYTKEILVQATKLAPEKRKLAKIFATASLSEKELFAGEQCTYTFKFYTSVNFSRATLQEPSFSGFFAKEAEKRKNYSENINGIPYKITEINYLLVPEKIGQFEIEPAAIMCEIPVSGRRDPFGNSFFSNSFFATGRTETKKIITESVKVKVKPLPIYKGKSFFSGLVGNFSIKAGLDSENVKAGDSVTFTITISGTGNVMDAVLPEISFPESFKIYDDEPEKKIIMTSKGYAGEKIFKKAVVPVKPGSFVIDPVTLTWFDVKSRKYESASTPLINFFVEKSDLGNLEKSSYQSGKRKDKKTIKKSVEITGHDIFALKEGPQVLTTRTSLPFYLFLFLLSMPGVIFCFFKVYLIFGRREASCSTIMEKRSKHNLQLAGGDTLEMEDFLRFLYTALVSKVLSKGGVKGESLTKVETFDILFSKGYSLDTVQDVSEMLSDIESARYGGVSSLSSPAGVREDFLKRLRTIFKTLGVVFLAVSCFLSLPSSLRADDSGTLFLKGVKEYRAGEFLKSAENFEELAEKGLKNGELYYNIGNSYLKAGKRGKAIIWYERAKQLIPLDSDLKFNLDYANGFVKDKREKQGVAVSDILFFWKAFFPSRTLQYGSLIVCMAFFVYAGIRTARKKRLFTWFGVVLFSIFVILTCTVFFDYYEKQMNHFAVVLPDQVSVRSGFSENSTELFILHSGTKVRVEKIKGDYLKIFFAKGKLGWIKKKSCQII